jgi:hypothetical protein
LEHAEDKGVKELGDKEEKILDTIVVRGGEYQEEDNEEDNREEDNGEEDNSYNIYLILPEILLLDSRDNLFAAAFTGLRLNPIPIYQPNRRQRRQRDCRRQSLIR